MFEIIFEFFILLGDIIQDISIIRLLKERGKRKHKYKKS